jgi:hypothetical protein
MPQPSVVRVAAEISAGANRRPGQHRMSTSIKRVACTTATSPRNMAVSAAVANGYRSRSQVRWPASRLGSGPMEGAMDKFISQGSWMRDIPDHARVTTLNIPGTHNSCSVGGLLGFGKTQNLDLHDQLHAGIRFLDIRLSHYQDNLFVHHDIVHMGKSYADVLTICADFLKQHPSEVILMSIKDEGRFDSGLGRFALSERFGRYRGDPTNWVVRSDSFEEAFKARTWQHVENTSLFFNFPAPLPNEHSAADNPALTPQTILGQVRGKIVLLRRFEGGKDIGCDCTYWPENRRFRSARGLIYAVEDRYQDPGEEYKYKFIMDHIEEARRRNPKDLYITFSSAVNLRARGYSNTINPRLNDYLANCPEGRVGIIAMDYFEEPRELVSNLIRTNFATQSVARHNNGHDDHKPVLRDQNFDTQMRKELPELDSNQQPCD